MDLAEVKQAVHDALDERDGLDRDTHRHHHQTWARWMENDDRRRQRIEKVKTQLLGSATLAVSGALLFAIGAAVKNWFNS